MNFKIIIIVLLISNAYNLTGQEWYENWDNNYPRTDLNELLQKEKDYAAKVESDSNEVQYYSRIDKYSLEGKYLKQTRKVDSETMKSMKHVFKLFIGKPEQLDDMVENEVLMEIDGVEIWMTIQKQLVKHLKKESKSRDKFIFYCLFLNEHTQSGQLNNNFIISEFR
jgi:hypothetical protein